MRWFRLLALLGAAAAPGCNLIYSGTSGVAGEVKIAVTHHHLVQRARQQAKAAWKEVIVANPSATLTEDFARGFEDGYVRTVWWGPEDSPIVPPSEYWSAHYQNAKGRQAIAQWIEGFRHGVKVAQETGMALSVKLPGPGLKAPEPDQAALPVLPFPERKSEFGTEEEKLPAPRPLPAGPVGKVSKPKDGARIQTAPVAKKEPAAPVPPKPDIIQASATAPASRYWRPPPPAPTLPKRRPLEPVPLAEIEDLSPPPPLVQLGAPR